MHMDERRKIAQQAYAKASRFLVHQRQWERSATAAIGAALVCAQTAILDQGGLLDDFQEELGVIHSRLSAEC